MDTKYTYKRPSSEQMEDFHVYVVPSNIWREKYNNMQNQDVTESISLGFIRIHPEAKIYSLREEIENQLDSPNLPQEYAFLKSVGRCLTKVKQHQEYQLKAKHFLPHFRFLWFCYHGHTIGAQGAAGASVIARVRSGWSKFKELLALLTSRALPLLTRNSAKSYGSELYLLDTSLMDTSSISDSNLRNSSQAITENHHKSEIGSYEMEMMPKYNQGHKTRNGVNNYNEEMPYTQMQENQSRTSFQTYRQQTPTSYKQNIYSELSFQNALKPAPSSNYSPEEIPNLLAVKPDSTSPPSSPNSKLTSVAKNSMRRSSPQMRASSVTATTTTTLPQIQSLYYSSRSLINGRRVDHFSDSYLPEYLAETNQKNFYTDSTGRSQEERELKQVGKDRQRQEEHAARQRHEEEKRRRERQAQEQLELEQKEHADWLRAEQQRKREEAAAEQQAAAKDAAAKEAAAAEAAAKEAQLIQMDEDGEMASQHQKWDSKRLGESNVTNNTDTKESDVTKNKRKEESEKLSQELETIREQRRAKERQREELVKRAKVLQARSQNKRNHARDIWKKRYYEEKKKTGPLEDHCNKLRQELDAMHRKFIASLDPPKEKPARVSTKRPSEKNNILIQATRLKHDTDDLHRRVDNAKMKLTAELKLRNQAEVELRALKAELIQQKINLNLLRKQQITGVIHQQGGSAAPSSTSMSRENLPILKQSQGIYTPRRQIPHT